MNAAVPEGHALSPVAAACRNCDGPLVPGADYCPHCGQETSLHPPSAREFLHEFVGHYVALEGKLWRTLGLLFFKPGSLTREYMAGRKQRYVLPLRLYLTASVLFFVIVKIVGVGDAVKVNMNDSPKAHAAKSVQGSRDAMGEPFIDMIKCDGNAAACQKIRAYVAEKYHGKTVRDMGEQVNRRLSAASPYAMFFLLPLFAAMTYVLYRRRGLMYGEHLVYAFHVHAFAFFSLLAMALAPPAAETILLIGLVYYFMALHRFFGGRIWVNLLRYATLSTAYVLAIALATFASLMIAILY